MARAKATRWERFKRRTRTKFRGLVRRARAWFGPRLEVVGTVHPGIDWNAEAKGWATYEREQRAARRARLLS